MNQLHQAKQYQLTHHTWWHSRLNYPDLDIDVLFLAISALVVASTTCRVIVNEFYPTTYKISPFNYHKNLGVVLKDKTSCLSHYMTHSTLYESW